MVGGLTSGQQREESCVNEKTISLSRWTDVLCLRGYKETQSSLTARIKSMIHTNTWQHTHWQADSLALAAAQLFPRDKREN